MNAAQNDVLETATTWCLRLAEGRLSSEEDEQLRQWLNADDVHASVFDETVAAWRAFESYEEAPTLMSVRHAALGEYGRHQNSRWRDAAKLHRRLVGSIAVGLCTVLVVGLVLIHDAMPDRYHTAKGERRTVALEDGSRLLLDAGSDVTVEYNGGRRDLQLLQGRASFSVSHDPTRPFSVSAGDKTIVATGTEFTVELLGATNEVRVTLLQGGVDVLGDRQPTLPEAARNRVRLARMSAGTELTSVLGTSSFSVKRIDPNRAMAWEDGLLAFDNELLPVAAERVNRQSATQVVLDDPTVHSLRLSGTFSAGDTAAFVEGVTGVLPVVANTREDDIVFTSK
jgi:transmembrane sensor